MVTGFHVRALVVVSAAAFAQDNHSNHAVAGLGTVNFPVSCSAAAQAKFTRAVALLHSFGYAESARAFADVAAADPTCGMAQWGVAMSYYHPQWAPPTPDELRKGSDAAALATKIPAKTDRKSV